MTESSLISVPRTPDEFQPPRPSSLTAEMAALMRNVEHWGQLVPYLDAIAGVGPSINGSPKFDEVGMILKAKSICDLNGYTLLAQATPAQLSPIFKRAFYTNTGVRIRRLQKQAAMLRLEKRAQS